MVTVAPGATAIGYLYPCWGAEPAPVRVRRLLRVNDVQRPDDDIARSRRLLTAPLSGHQVMINGHALCPPFSFVRGCDPCPPGTAVERPQRSEDERPGRPTVSGTPWRRPPRSRNVAERRATAAPDPPICTTSVTCARVFGSMLATMGGWDG